jgi:nucleoside-diphosphate-sugar epimerase
LDRSAEAVARYQFLITGGSGFLVINLCRYLLARGHKLRSLDIGRFDHPELGRVEAIAGDVDDRDAVERAMAGVEIVIHAAAALPLSQRDDIISTDQGGTRTVLEAAFNHGISRLMFTSSTSVYGIPDHHPLYEEDKLQGVGPYGEATIAALPVFPRVRTLRSSITAKEFHRTRAVGCV